MATRDEWPEESGPRDPWEERTPRSRGMSTGSKILIVLLSLGGIVVLLCCGAAFWLWSKVDFEVVEQPDAAAETAADIARIEVPEQFKPKRAMRMKVAGIGMEMAEFELQGGAGSLVLGEMQGFPPGNVQPEVEMRQTLNRQGEQKELTVNRSESREFEVRGEKTRFTFAEAVDEAGKEFRRVSGSFRTEDGVGVLILEVPVENYDEESIVQMIESIE